MCGAVRLYRNLDVLSKIYRNLDVLSKSRSWRLRRQIFFLFKFMLQKKRPLFVARFCVCQL